MKIEISDQSYTISLTQKDMDDERVIDAMQTIMDEEANEYNKQIEGVETEFEVSLRCASNIVYLRSRSRWSQELEDELIRMDKEDGTQPNIMEWP